VLYPVALKYVTELAFADVSVVAPGTWWVQQALAKLKAHGKVPKLGVHLFVDTGMGRDGVMPDSAPELASIIQKSAAHLHMRGVMSHLCCTSYITSAKRHGNSSPENIKDMFGGEGKVKAWNKPDMTSLQLRRFSSVMQTLKQKGLMPDGAVAHIGSSGAVSQGMHDAAFDMVRVGRMLVDGDSDDAPKAELVSIEKQPDNTPELASCQLQVMTTKTLPADWCVGYGCETLPNIQRVGKLKEPKRVAILQEDCPRGWAGPNAGLSENSYANAHGEKLKILLAHGSCGTVLEASAATVCKATAVTDVRLIPAVGVDLVHVLLTRSVIPPVLALSASLVVTVR